MCWVSKKEKNWFGLRNQGKLHFKRDSNGTLEDSSKANNYGLEEKNIQGKVNHENKCEELREML